MGRLEFRATFLLFLGAFLYRSCQCYNASPPPPTKRQLLQRIIIRPWEGGRGKILSLLREMPVRTRALRRVRRHRSTPETHSASPGTRTAAPLPSPTLYETKRVVSLPKPTIFRELRRPDPIPVMTRQELSELIGRFKGGKKALARLSVMGATGDAQHEHPVVQLVHARRREGSRPGQRKDSFKIGLAIEGGGMRGAVSAGAAAALQLLGLNDAVDVVYGSSAGALVAAFFVSRQLNGTLIYSETLPRAGKEFLDRSRLMSAMGIGFIGAQSPPPVINLDYLLDTVITNKVPLDWERLWANNQVQPVKVIASGLCSMQSYALSSEDGHFSCRDSFLACMRASMCVPGVAGPSVRLQTLLGPHGDVTQEPEPLADALLFQPIPFRSAVADGCTHVICLRSRPDGSEILGKKASGVYEDWIAKRFLKEHNKCPGAADHMTSLDHIRIYAEDILIMNEASKKHQAVSVPGASDPYDEGRKVHLLPIAPPASCAEVDTLETRREELVRGLKEGFASAWDIMAPRCLVADLSGEQAAEQLFSVEASGFEDNWVAFADACNLMMEAENRLQSQDTHMEEHLTGEAFAML